MEIRRATRAPLGWRRWIPLGLALGAAFGVGVVFQRERVPKRVKAFLSHDLGTVARNWVSARFTEPDRLILDVDHEHWEKLSAWQMQADEKWQITPDLKEYVPAQVTVDGETARARIRLKGEWGDHVDTDKWSLRIKLRGDKSLFGMRRFSIQHPKVRSYAAEWVYQESLRREDVLALRYRFITVTINGRDMGVYALEEHFAKELLESQERRAGVVVKFNADYRYKPVATRQGSLFYEKETGMIEQQAADVVVYDEEKVRADPMLNEEFELAREWLNGLRAGSYRTSEVFEPTRLARYLAVSELLGTLEAAGDWSDMRFAYDPIAARLEPIGVEGALFHDIDGLLGPRLRYVDPRSDFHAALFDDDEFYATYLSELARVSRPEYVDRLEEELGPGLAEELAILHREWPEQSFSFDRMRRNARTIRDFFEVEKGLHAWLAPEDAETQENEGAELEVGAITALPVEVLALSRGTDRVTLDSPRRLEGRALGRAARYERIAFARTPEGPEAAAPPPDGEPPAPLPLLLHYRMLGSVAERTAEVFPDPRRDAALAARTLQARKGNADRHPFVLEGRAWTIAAGRHVIDEDLVVPRGTKLVVEAGAELLLQGGSILARSPIELRGTEASPVRVLGAGTGGGIDGTGGGTDEAGGGILVIDAAGESVLEHVEFRGLTLPAAAGAGLTGAVTFYRSPVTLDHVTFTDCRSEDSLNLVRSPYRISDGTFSGSPSDAFDGDFSDGRFERCLFQDVAGDAIDVSGSRVEVFETTIQDCADKAISVGEASTLVAADCTFADAGIGVASKDLSEVELRTVRLLRCATGLAIYVKKPAYGPGAIRAEDLHFEDVGQRYRLERGSVLRIDGEDMAPNADDLAAELYAEEP